MVDTGERIRTMWKAPRECPDSRPVFGDAGMTCRLATMRLTIRGIDNARYARHAGNARRSASIKPPA